MGLVGRAGRIRSGGLTRRREGAKVVLGEGGELGTGGGGGGGPRVSRMGTDDRVGWVGGRPLTTSETPK
jgi:hypothetical protein